MRPCEISFSFIGAPNVVHSQVLPGGFEPPTGGLENRCCCPLSYESEETGVGFEPTNTSFAERCLRPDSAIPSFIQVQETEISSHISNIICVSSNAKNNVLDIVRVTARTDCAALGKRLREMRVRSGDIKE